MATTSTGAATTQDAASLVAPTTYQIDPARSHVTFAIRKRLFFVRSLVVTGHFRDVAGTIALDGQDPTSAQAAVTIGAVSIDTQNARRDKHLRTADFFDVDRHPTLTFRSRRVEPVAPLTGRYRAVGDLTVRGVTREVVLETSDGPVLALEQDRRIALKLTALLNRQDFGMAWNSPVIKIADDLTVTLLIQATRV